MMAGVSHVAVGHLNLDVYVVVDSLPGPDENVVAREAYVGPGGAAANYAVAAARLGSRVYLVAHTGKLARSLGILSNLEAEGVRLDYVRIHEDLMPGLVIVVVTKGGERSMITMRGANNMLRGDEASGLRSDVLHVASRGPDTLGRAAASVEASFTSYDPGASNTSRDPQGVLSAARKWANLLVLNRAEYGHLLGSTDIRRAMELLEGKLEMAIIKQGAKGAYLVMDNSIYHVEAFNPGRVVDTTGAGDVFIATFNTYYMETRDPLVALQAASIAAGIKVSRRGAQSAPRREEVEEVLSTRPPRVKKVG